MTTFAERLARAGFIRCPGPGCLALVPVGSGRVLCRFCAARRMPVRAP